MKVKGRKLEVREAAIEKLGPGRGSRGSRVCRDFTLYKTTTMSSDKRYVMGEFDTTTSVGQPGFCHTDMSTCEAVQIRRQVLTPSATSAPR